MSPLRWIVTALSFAAALGASLYLAAGSWPAGAGAGALALPWPAHAVALAATAIEILSRALKIQLGARALHVPLSFGTAFRTVLGGDFGAAVTPARSGAEPARFLVIAEAGTPPAGTLLVLFAEMVLETLSLALAAVVLALLFRSEGRALGGIVGVVGGYAMLVLVAGFGGLALARRSAGGPPPAWARRLGLHAGRWRAVQRSLRHLRTSVDAVRTADVGLLALAFLASMVHVAMRLVVLPALVLFSAPRTKLAPLVLWPLALVYGGVVAPAPGGGGFIEVAFKATLGNTIPADLFAPALVWWRFYTFYLYVILGAVAAGGTVLRALRGRPEARTTRRTPRARWKRFRSSRNSPPPPPPAA